MDNRGGIVAYNKDVYLAAYKILEERRDKNKYIRDKRKEEINLKIPEYLKLKNELMSLLGGAVSSFGGVNKNTVDIKKAIFDNEEKRKKLLCDNGYSSDYLDEIFCCKKCKDTGYILDKKCECLEKLLVERAIENSSLSNAFSSQNFDNFDITVFSDEELNGISPRKNIKQILSHIKDFIDNLNLSETKSLLFTGNTGVGKTFLSSCIAKKLTEMGFNVVYETAANVCELMDTEKFGKASVVSDRNTVKNLYSADLLIIDDLGTEFRTQYTLSALYELLNSRLINNKKMIINTNLSIKELKDLYSERIFSRFLGHFNILEFIGEDLRTKEIFEKSMKN